MSVSRFIREFTRSGLFPLVRISGMMKLKIRSPLFERPIYFEAGLRFRLPAPCSDVEFQKAGVLRPAHSMDGDGPHARPADWA